MAQRLWTPQDLPADFKLVWYHFPDTSTVTLDANNRIAAIADKFGSINPATSPSTGLQRCLPALTNGATGYSTASSDGYNYAAITVSDLSAFPSASADRYFAWIVNVDSNMGGIIGGYRVQDGIDTTQMWLDSIFKVKSGVNLTGETGLANGTMNMLAVNYANKTLTLRANGAQKAQGTTTLTGSYPFFGIRAAMADYYNMVGKLLGFIAGKRAATQDEQWKIEWWYSTFTGKALPSDNPYAASPPMVDDGTASGVTGTSASTLGAIGLAASAALLIAGAASIPLGAIGVSAAASVPIRATAVASLGSISASGAGSAIIKASAAPTLQPIIAQASGQLPVTGAAAPTIGAIAVTSAGALPIRGVASAALDQIATSSAGELDIHGTASATLGAVEVDARGAGVQSTSGALATALDPITAAASGVARISAASGTTLAPVQATGAGSARIVASMAGQLASITVSAAATVPLRAAAAVFLGPIAIASDARLPIRGAASVTLGPIGFAASALSDGEPVITPPERIVRAPAQLRLVRAIARPRLVFARG